MVNLPRHLAAAAVLLALTVAACGEEAPPADSGLAGLVLIGPMCPVVQEGVPCPDEPFQADLNVLEPGSDAPVATVRSGADGRFQVALAPGDYVLEPLSPTPGAPPFAAPLDVEVEPHAFTEVTVIFDSGIR